MKKSNFYANYMGARDKAWEVILNNKVDSLPVDLFALAKSNGICVKTYERGKSLFRLLQIEDVCSTTDGFTSIILGLPYIFYDSNKPMPRQLFTIAHEMGHIFLGHSGSKVLTRCLAQNP